MVLLGIGLGVWLDIFERVAIYFYCIRFKCVGVVFMVSALGEKGLNGEGLN